MNITSDMISLIFSLIALLVSLFGVWYSRQRTKIMENQHESKRVFEEISKVILTSVRILRDMAKLEEHNVDPIALTSSDILSFIHDNKSESFKLNVKPRKITLSFSSKNRKDYVVEDFRNMERISREIKEEIRNIVGCYLEFDCHPDIISNKWLGVGDVLYTVAQLSSSYKLLKDYENYIVPFDSTVLDDLEQHLDSMLDSLIRALTSEHTIHFDSTVKSRRITKQLLNEMVDWESMKICLIEISVQIRDRLLAVQKEIFSRS